MTVLPLVGGILVVYFLFSFVVVVAFFPPLNLGVFFMQMCAVGDCLVFFFNAGVELCQVNYGSMTLDKDTNPTSARTRS